MIETRLDPIEPTFVRRDVWGDMRKSGIRVASFARKISPPGVIGLVLVTLFVSVAILGPIVSPYDPHRQDLGSSLQPPNAEHWFGTDQLGRDLFSRVLVGARYSLAIGIASVLLGVLIGVPVGLFSGFSGGWLDVLLMRSMDFQLALPRILVCILLSTLFGVGLTTLIAAVGFSSIPIFGRLTRASSLQVSQEDFVLAARAIGVPTRQLLLRHILPNAFPPVMLQATFEMAFAILLAGGLSFVGLGVTPPTPEWGAMLADARNYMRTSSYLINLPGLALAASVLGINLLGDALREYLDPRMRIK